MRDLIDVRIRRGLLVMAAASICLSVAPPVSAKEAAKEAKWNFVPGTDISAWYWERQVDEEVTTPVGLPPPIPPASQRARLPNPQRPNTLPVALNQGQSERKSAIRFDGTAEDRGLTDGSKIKELILYVQESVDRNEQPQTSPETAKIQACQILEFLPQGEEERYADAPKFDDKNCVEGTRDAGSSPPAVWTFDLTKIAAEWAKRSYDNNGVMLVPILEPGKTWQVNLKVPRKEAPSEEGDQYELTKDFAFVTVDFIPGEPLEIPEVPSSGGTTTTPPSTGGTSTIPSSSGLSSSGSPLITPSTDLSGASDVTGAAPVAPPVPSEQAAFTPPLDQEPRMPAYVWLAIPLGLLALSAIRSVILEPVGGPRPDGVIAAIRRRNAERRGDTLGTGQGGIFTMMTGGVRRGAGGLRKAFGSFTSKMRRKP